jgi:alkylation response protein AidB-like acyl-CoA dehydrogenase
VRPLLSLPCVLRVMNFSDMCLRSRWQNIFGDNSNSTLSGDANLKFPALDGSDATHMFTHAVKATRNGIDGWVLDGGKMWISGMHRATHCLVFARTHGKAGDALGITAFFAPKNTPGFQVESYEWTFNMPTDHASKESVFDPFQLPINSIP